MTLKTDRKRMQRWLAAALTIVTLLVVAGCGGGGAVNTTGGNGGGNAGGTDNGKVHLTMFIWAGSHQGDVPRAVVKKYLADHPNVSIDFVESNNTVTYPKMVAAKKATPDQPYVDFGFFNVTTMAQGDVDGMWEPLDPSAVPNMSHVLKDYHRPDNMGVGYQVTTIGLLYNKDHIKTPPDSWTALWDPKYKGKVVTFDYDWQALVLAARLNGGSAKNIDPGFKIWSQYASNFKALVSSNDQLKNLLVSGDAWLGPWFGAISKVWIDEGAPLGYTNPKEGDIAFPVYLSLVKGITPAQKKVAEDIINLLLAPDNAGKYGELTYSIPLVDNATLTDAQKSDPNLQLSVAKNAMQFDWGTIAKQNDTWKQRWDQEVKSKMH